MDQKVQKLKKYVEENIGINRKEVLMRFGKPSKAIDDEVWFYFKFRNGIFKDEIAFIFENNIVIDIAITEYILWITIRNIFYYEHEEPAYKVFNLF